MTMGLDSARQNQQPGRIDCFGAAVKIFRQGDDAAVRYPDIALEDYLMRWQWCRLLQSGQMTCGTSQNVWP